MSTLYADLDPDVAAEITTALDAQGDPLRAGWPAGRIIQVPSSDVHQVRLDLAAQDLPGGNGGWDVLDDQSITASAFDQRVGYQRAMEGELARTISSIDDIRTANVHLVIPERDLFAGDDQHASASILVDTGGQSLSAMQVQAVVNLVASSIEGLTSDAVSVADEAGQVLWAAGEGTASFGVGSEARMRAQIEVERALEVKIESMLVNVVGPGLVEVAVNAELDFDEITTTSEDHQPVVTADGDQAVVSETTSDRLYRDEIPVAQEDGELAIELPEDVLVDDDGDGTIDEGVIVLDQQRQTDSLYDTVARTTISTPGEIESLSVSVLLDEAEVDEARLGDIEQLVNGVVGLNEERGDLLTVQLLPFDEDVKAAIEATAVEVEPAGEGLDLVALVRTAGTAIVALVVLLLAIRSLSRNPRRQVIESVELSELGAGTAAALEAGTAVDTTGRADDDEAEPPELRLQHLIANQTDEVAGVLRTWLSEGDEVSV